MALLVTCYKLVIKAAAPAVRRLYAYRPRARHWLPGKRTAQHTAAAKAAAVKTILVCTVSGGLGYGTYRALGDNAPPPGGSSFGGAGLDFQLGPDFLAAALTPPFPFDTIAELQVPPGGDTITNQVPEPATFWILAAALFLLGVTQWLARAK